MNSSWKPPTHGCCIGWGEMRGLGGEETQAPVEVCWLSVFLAPLHSFLSDKGRAKGQGTSRCKQVLFKRSFVLEQPKNLVAQLVKNPPAMKETWVRSLGWEDPLENGKATHSSILAERIPWTV